MNIRVPFDRLRAGLSIREGFSPIRSSEQSAHPSDPGSQQYFTIPRGSPQLRTRISRMGGSVRTAVGHVSLHCYLASNIMFMQAHFRFYGQTEKPHTTGLAPTPSPSPNPGGGEPIPPSPRVGRGGLGGRGLSAQSSWCATFPDWRSTRGNTAHHHAHQRI